MNHKDLSKYSPDMVAEAIERMKMIGIIDDAINQFKNDGVVMCSEPPYGALFWLDDEQAEIAAQFENDYDALVYLAVKSFTIDGTMISLFYVSKYREEWGEDREDLRGNYTLTYTHNFAAPDCSEIGGIDFKSVGGGVIRTA